MNQKYPVLVGRYSYQKKKFLCEKIRSIMKLPDVNIHDRKNLKYKEARSIAQGNEAIAQDIESSLYALPIETVFFLSTKHPLFRRLQKSGFSVVSTDTILRNFSGNNVGTRFKAESINAFKKQKEKTRRFSHAVSY